MEWLNNLLDSSTIPAFTALILGLLTALSPCPLATNIAAIGYISKDITDRRNIFIKGLLYTLGRTLAYTVLGIVLITVLRNGASIFSIQDFIARYGEILLGPALLLIGLFMLLGGKMNLPSIGIGRNREGLAAKGGLGALLLGMLFAMAFCPTSGVLYFGMLIPMSATSPEGYLYPILFAIATALPVIIVAWVLAFSASKISETYGKMKTIQKWLNIIVGILFTCIGIYYTIILIS